MYGLAFSKLDQKLHLSFCVLLFFNLWLGLDYIVLPMFLGGSLFFILYCLYVILWSSNMHLVFRYVDNSLFSKLLDLLTYHIHLRYSKLCKLWHVAYKFLKILCIHLVVKKRVLKEFLNAYLQSVLIIIKNK